ncbi:hypothetical protein LINPERHAP1_LOCUS25052 [Linum perenne]
MIPPNVGRSASPLHPTSAPFGHSTQRRSGVSADQNVGNQIGHLLARDHPPATAHRKPPMGLTHHTSRVIKKEEVAEFLDPDVPNCPVEEALCLAKLAIRCWS